MDHKDVAQRVLTAIGGEDNLKAAAHCATRLRLVIVDEGKIDVDALDNDPDLKGTFSAGGMFQIIVGPGDVDEVYKEILALTGGQEISKDDLKQVADQKANWLVRAIKVLADIFVPLIPVLVGGGLLMALNNVLTANDLFGPRSVVEMYPAIQGVSELINLIASAPFAFLPILIGFTATKRFGGNPYLGAAMGMAMVMPALVNGYSVAETFAAGEMTYWDIFGLNVAQAGYQGTVLPVLAVSFLLAKTEKLFRRLLSGVIDFMFTPMFSLLITGFITFIVIGPILRDAGDWLAQGIQWLYEAGGPIGGFLFGLIYSPIVVTGLHQSFPAIELQLIAQGGSFIFAIASVANLAQGAAAFAVFLTTRNEKLKGVAGASSFSAMLGITEPAIFGVNLRLRYPFYIAMGSAAISGALIALLNVQAVALGAAGLLGFVSIRAANIPAFFLVLAIDFAIAFTVTYFVARRKVKAEAAADAAAAATLPAGGAAALAASTEVEAQALTEPAEPRSLIAPLAGEVKALSEVSDPVFSAGKLGHGLAILPSEGKLIAPADGKITVAFKTGHAVALRTEDGVDVLIHIGFDTVQLDGQHFTAHVAKGDTVTAGQTLIEFDREAILAAGYDLTTPVVVTNYKKRGPIDELATSGQQITFGEDFLTVHPKAPVADTTPVS